MSDAPPEILADATLVQIPPERVVSQIYDRSSELAKIELEIARKTAELQQLNDDRRRLAERELPQLFDQVQTDRFGIPGYQADVILEPVYKANIAADWDDEARERGFNELERLGGEDLIKIEVSVQFTRGEFETAAEFVQHINRWNKMGGRTVRITKGVPWNTLTVFVRDMAIKKVPMDLQALGAFVGRVCKIKWRK